MGSGAVGCMGVVAIFFETFVPEGARSTISIKHERVLGDVGGTGLFAPISGIRTSHL